MTNRVFLLGGGRMGLVAAKDLVRSPAVDLVIIGDKDPSRAEKLASETGSRKVTTTKVDANKHQDLVQAIRGSKVIINAVWYEHNLAVMRAAIEAKVHYNDLGGLFHMTKRQMELDGEARQAGITAVLGGGESPGISNIMCAASAQNLDSIEEMRIRVGGRETTRSPSDKLVFPFAVSTVFDEYSKPPVMYVDGQFQELAPLSGEEEVEFPGPVGRNLCHYSIHSEIATLPLVFKGVRTVDFKLGVSDKIFKAVKPLLDAGLADPSPLDVGGRFVSPREFAIALLSSRASDEEPSRHVALMTKVTGTKNGQRVRGTRVVLGEPSETLGVKNATGVLTGVAASIVSQLILTGEVTQRGVLPPEVCVPTAYFFSELERRGIVVTASETELGEKESRPL